MGGTVRALSGYKPQQSKDLYKTSGDTTDWAFGEHGILSYTTEIGSWGDNFDPPYAKMTQFWNENRPGALLHVLAPFDASEINLTFIQSRPLPGRPWEYGFFIEAATDWRSASAKAAWQLVQALSESGRRIGTYPVL